MKRLQRALALVLLLALVLTGVPVVPVAAEEVAASGTCGDGLTWEVKGTTLIISGTGAMTNFTSTTQPWKDYRSVITSVTIQDGVTSVGKNAFYYCRKITEVSLPDTVTTVAYRAFYKADALTDVYYAGTMAQWDAISVDSECGTLLDAKLHMQTGFGLCGENLRWELLGGVLTVSGTGAMDNYTTPTQPWKSFRSLITSVVIKEGVTSIGKYAFYYCRYMDRVDIPQGLTTVAPYAFYKAAIANVYYDGSQTQWDQISIGIENAPLTSANLHLAANAELASGTCGEQLTWSLSNQGVLTISGTGAMTDFTQAQQPWKAYRSQIKSIVVGDGVTTIGTYAFYYCSQATTITIANTVTKISKNATLSCKKLENVNYGSSAAILELITHTTGNDKLLGATLNTAEPVYKELQLTKPTKLIYQKGEPLDLSDMVVTLVDNNGNAVKREDYILFGYDATALKTQTITVVCQGLYTTFDVNVRMEGDTGKEGNNIHWVLTDEIMTLSGTGEMADQADRNDCFFGTAQRQQVKNLVVEEGITYLGKFSFYFCYRLVSAKLPSTLTKISSYCFQQAGRKTTDEQGKTVYLPIVNVHYNGTAFQWSKVSVGKTQNTTLTEAPNWFFQAAKIERLELTRLPDKVEYNLGEALDKTGMVVTGYYNDGDSKPVELDKVTVSGYLANNPKTQTLTVTYNPRPELPMYFDVKVRAGGQLSDAVSWTLEENVLTIFGEGAMPVIGTCPWSAARANNIHEIVIEEGITSISNKAFYYSKSVKTVRLPETLKTIEANAFQTCNALTDVYFAGSESQWNQINIVATNNSAITNATVHFGKEDNALTGITVTAPTKIAYWKGEDLDLTGMVVTGTYADGTTAQITEGYTVTGYKDYMLGEQTVTVEYEGFTATFTVTVSEVYLVEMLLTPPTQTEYAYGEELDTLGMVVDVKYSDGKISRIAAGYQISGYNANKSGAQTVTVTYQTVSATFTVTVAEPVIAGLHVTLPTKTEYAYGEELDLTGMLVQASYSDGSSRTVTDYILSGYDAYTAGVQTIYVTYEGISVDFTVTVAAPALTGITITTPNKTEYWTGEELDLTGMIVTASYSDGTTETVTDYTVTGYDAAVIGGQLVTVTYEGMVATFPVQVKELSVIGLYVEAPEKTTYLLYEELDTTGMVVTVTWSNGAVETLTTEYLLSGYDPNTVGEQTVTVSFGGWNAFFTVTVEEPAPEVGQLILDTVSGKGGDTVQVKLSLADNPGITCAKLQLTYDVSVLTLTEVTDGGILGETVHKPELVSPYTLCWANDLATENFTTNGVLATLTFAIAEGAPAGEYPIAISYGTTNGDIMDAELMDVPFQATNGSVTVEQSQQEEEDDGTAKLVLDSVSGTAGETVAVTLKIKNNPGIASAKLKLNFDSDVLTLVEVADGGILGSAVHRPQLTSPYTLCWANDLATENFTTDGTLVTLYFTIAENAPAGSYALTLTYGTTNGDIMDVDLNDVAITAVQGNVTVK